VSASSLTEVTFNSLYAEPSRNGLYKSKEFHGSGARIVNMGELFGHEWIGAQDMKLVQITDVENERFGLKVGDLLFGRRSLIESGAGKCSLVTESDGNLTFESSIIRIRLDQTKANPRYFYYYFKSPEGRSRISAIVGGANVKGIRSSDLGEIKVHLPTPEKQATIAQQLAYFDDLIATNQERIRLLEEATNLIYTEWFVQLRFPGHNPSLRANDLPCGWRRDRFDSVLTLQRGFDLPADQRIDGDIPIIASTGICGTHSISKVSGPGVVTGRSGTLGKVRLVLEDFWPLNTTLWIKAYRGISPYFAYFLLQGLNLASLNVGASVPSLDRNTVHPLPIIVPDAKTLAKFDETVTPIFQQIDTLERQIKQLKSARDLLLPRLISGQLRL
jgi:type I restriction enzyme S subunit